MTLNCDLLIVIEEPQSPHRVVRLTSFESMRAANEHDDEVLAALDLLATGKVSCIDLGGGAAVHTRLMVVHEAEQVEALASAVFEMRCAQPTIDSDDDIIGTAMRALHYETRDFAAEADRMAPVIARQEARREEASR